MTSRASTRRRAFLVAFAVALGFAASARADLDVGVPPGTPLDWVSEIPRRTPTGSVKVPTGQVTEKGPVEQEPGKTVSRPVEKPAEIVPSDVGVQTAMGYARILTVDIGTHIQWVLKRPPLEIDPTPKKTLTGNAQAGEIAPEYPPKVSNDLFWLTSAVLLRKLIHPELVSSAESTHLLVLMGEPSLVACAAGEGETRLTEWIHTVRNEVRGISEVRPWALASKDPEENMLLRLAAEDLASGYPTGFDGDFASHLLALEPFEAAPLLAKYLEPSAHTFLRRNAAALLANYSGEAPNAALLKVLNANEQDGVVRARVADALARRQEAGAVPWLEKSAQNKGILRPIALYLLGEIGEPQAAKTVLKALEEREDPDVLWSAVPACARIRHEKPKEAILALKKLAKFLLEAEEGTFYEKAQYPNDLGTDETLLRVSCLLEMTTIALARLGDEGSKKEIERVLAGEAIRDIPGGSKIRKVSKASPIAGPDTFGGFHVPSLVLLVESLASMGDTGRKRLEIVSQDTVCEVPLRLQALDGLARAKALEPGFLEKLMDDEHALVRARALKLLATLDEARARKAATKVLEAYDDTKAARRGEGADTVQAVRVLAKGKAPVPLLVAALKIAREAADNYKPKEDTRVLGDMTISVRPPVLEEVLKALGSSGDEAALRPLLDHAGSKEAPARAAAVAALGGFEKTRAALVTLLDDDEGWVRYVAYRVLKRRAPPGFKGFADWIYGSRAERADALKAWKGWLKDDVARDSERKSEDVVERALAAWTAKAKDADAWAKARTEMKSGGLAVLKRLLEVAGDAKKADAAFACLRAATGEAIPDDYEAWKGYLDSMKK